VLAQKIRPCDATHSPWPFRVDVRDGRVIEEYTSHWIPAIRLFDELTRIGRIDYGSLRGDVWIGSRNTRFATVCGRAISKISGWILQTKIVISSRRWKRRATSFSAVTSSRMEGDRQRLARVGEDHPGQ